jgi:GT2 family glycosyltransferase
VTLRYLFGPVDQAFADDNLAGPRQAGLCLTFGPGKGVDLAIGPGDSSEQIQQRLPAGWQPDLLVFWLAYSTVPAGLWSAPLPRAGLARDWRFLWHDFRERLPLFDVVWTDTVGAELLQRAGIRQARPAVLCGCGRSFLEQTRDEVRDIDILLVGNLNPAVQRERMAWLPRLARLGQRWRVAIRSGMPVESYRRVLARTRIVVQHSPLGLCGRRAFEAAAAGALVFQEQGNRELPALLRDRQECVYYQANNLEELLAFYLEHDEEGRRLADAARQRVAGYRFEDFWQTMIAELERDWPLAAPRQPSNVSETSEVCGQEPGLWARCWQAYTSGGMRQDRFVIADLEKRLAAQTDAALHHNAIGALLARQPHTGSAASVAAEVAAEHFRRARDAQPEFALAGLNLSEALETAGQRLAAVEAARRTLELIQTRSQLDDASQKALLFARPFDVLHVEWERAGWSHAGDPAAEAAAKRTLLLWRLYALLGQRTGEAAYLYEAALLRPDLGPSRAALGKSLLRDGRPAEALPHLRQALAAAPLDRDTARATLLAWNSLGYQPGRQQLVEERRLLSRAAPTLLPAEPWFTGPAPRGNELVSILILCCNQLDYTRLCLESLWKHTRAPYEVILVDNGSTDATAAYLEEMSRRPGPERVEIIRNETNLGFARGCNQALAQARGRYVVFLNNDTVLTPGWLEGLVAGSLREWPAVGLVGPVANTAPDAQCVRPGYDGLDGLETFAAQRRQAFAGRLVPVRRLTGFCLLVRREVLERIGSLDERFGIGFFEDDDLCVRAREAGFQLAIAQEVYIHHFGSRTFQALGLNTRDQLVENFERFREKWGPEQAAGYRLPPAPSANGKPDDANGAAPAAPIQAESAPAAEAAQTAPATGGTDSLAEQVETLPERDAGARSDGQTATMASEAVKVSLCMIVRNEEKHLPGCLESIRPLVEKKIIGEVIINDTGSTDRTREVAREFGAQVVESTWPDSFGAARNESLRHARGKFILWLDADDRINAENLDKLEKHLSGLGEERDCCAMKVRSVLDPAGSAFRLLDQVRLFPNLPGVQWDYRIHEQILPAVNRVGGVVRWWDVIIDHVGYQDAGARKGKLERNLRLLELDYAQRANDGFTLFNLGWTLLDLGRQEEALGHLQHALTETKPTSSTLRKLYHLLAVAHKALGRRAEALAVCAEGLERFADDAELLLEQGLLLREAKDLAGTEEAWLRLLEGRKGQYFASEEVGLRGYRTRHLLAEIYVAQERWVEAEVQWRAALKERSDFEPAWMGLCELLLRQSRWADLEELLDGLHQAGVAPARVGWLRARGQAQRQELAGARRTLQQVIALDPVAHGPRVLLSQVLLREGRDWAAAEQALHEVLKLQPNNAEANNNLRILRRRLGRQAVKE